MRTEFYRYIAHYLLCQRGSCRQDRGFNTHNYKEVQCLEGDIVGYINSDFFSNKNNHLLLLLYLGLFGSYAVNNCAHHMILIPKGHFFVRPTRSMSLQYYPSISSNPLLFAEESMIPISTIEIEAWDRITMMMMMYNACQVLLASTMIV